MRIPIMGVGFDNVTMGEAVEIALQLCERGGYIVTPNPEILWNSRKDVGIQEAMNMADLVVADGIGVVYAAKILKRPICEKVPGLDLATNIIRRLSERKGRIFLFGAKPGIADIAAHRISEDYPGIVIVGTANGYDTKVPIIEMVNESKPDMLLVCLGMKRQAAWGNNSQETWMRENKDKLPKCLMIGLGGSIDTYAGVVKRAPARIRAMNLEWLYRLIKQPSRIVRMVKLPLFLLSVVLSRISGE